MPRLPRISGNEAVRALERLGFIQTRQTGSHVVLKKATLDGEIVCVVPVHR
ncbi:MULTISPECIES: type II toxin-antitoxin system HicA family toxin [unclassified Nostoc]|uniref:type II toxin-antitoxin system HicA family toxin n=1 Tax=unclassified Nostoc TaxID=2593658 RepID=UPI0025EB2AE4|nr:type II toxin-antitoxin system HicA family toxin [Nostoc sp. JL23]